MRRSLLVFVGLLTAALAAHAEPRPPASTLPQAWTDASLSGAHPTLAAPWHVAGPAPGAGMPVWMGPHLVPYVPRYLFGLARSPKPGIPVYDPSADAWFASSAGTLVRLEPDGRLVVVADNIQGIDVDVRAVRGIAVSREPDDSIVVHRWTEGAPVRVAVLRGAGFFRPRFSPDGSRIVVSQSRAEGGHIWVVDESGRARDLTQGYGASWHPDGRRLVFARIQHDARTILSSELWMVDAVTGEERLVGRPAAPAIEPVISPDGGMIVFLHGVTRDVQVARWSDPWAREATP